MKGIVIIVFVVLISVTYGTKNCEVTKKENEKCGNNGKCTTPVCVPAPATTLAAPSTTTPAPSTTHVTRRKRRGAEDPAVAECTTTCAVSKVCRYQCTGESGSIKHGLSPLVLLVGVLTKLFLIG